MLSSTSNSDKRIADGPWLRTGILAVLIAVVALGSWEGFWRSRGFEPGFNDDHPLWAHARRKVAEDDPGEIVLLGASRMQIGINLKVMEEVLGRRPVQLAMDGCLCLPILDHLSQTEGFVGTVVMDVWPTAFYKRNPARGAAEGALKYYDESAFSQGFEDMLSLHAQRSLVFRLPDLSFKQLRRSHKKGEWPTPSYTRLFLDRSRKADYELVKTFDLPQYIETKEPTEGDPESKTPEQWLEFVQSISEMVDRIEARGGRVVIAFLPSTGGTRQWEEASWPRHKYWDVLAENTSAIMIHPDDYVSLDGFNCPDGSHLDYRDSPAFTRVFAKILEDKLAGDTPEDYVSPETRHTRINHAERATIFESPKFIEKYEFSVALREDKNIAFASAEEPNPATVILDLGEGFEPSLIEMVQYAWQGKQWSYQDYAWHVSSDQKRWRCVFDSRNDTSRRRWSRAPDNCCFDLRGIGSWRFLRLTLREALSDNRLLLRRLFIWSNYTHQDWLKPAEALPLVKPPADENAEYDLATGATLVDGPLFKQGHDFSVALRGREDARHVETQEPGPFSVVVDLGWTVEAGSLVLLYQSTFAAPRGYRWEVSKDRETWTEVYDSANKNARMVGDGLRRRYSLAGRGPIRFLRLTVRDKDLGRKLQLRRLSVLREALPPPPHPSVAALPPLEARSDLAAGAHVLESPKCAPGYEFSMALRGRQDEYFVSATEHCPATVTIDLEKTRPASLLKLHGHDAARRWEDYAILVSEDGQSWFEVFDARSETRRSLIPFSELVTGYDLRDASAFRYIRLDVRSAKLENRILLNRLSVWVEDDSATWPNAIEVERIAP